MKTRIIYSTRSGNTQKLAESIYDELDGEREIVPITQVGSLNDDYDLIAVGFPIMAARIEPRAARFLSSYENRAKIFLFVTHGSAEDSDLVKGVMEQAYRILENSVVVGSFSCRGQVDPKVLRKLKKAARPLAWLSEADDSSGHPDQGDINALRMAIRDIC